MIASCAPPPAQPASLPPTPDLTPTQTHDPWPAGAGPCTFTTTEPTTLYARPSRQADIFFQAEAGLQENIVARAGVWAGFNPSIAQAANIGPFHLRWVETTDVLLSGDCAAIEEVWAPLPGFCYDMPMEAVPVYTDPDAASPLITTLQVGDFAALLGTTADGWAQIDLTPGNTGLVGTGWLAVATLNMNGAACDSLPALTP